MVDPRTLVVCMDMGVVVATVWGDKVVEDSSEVTVVNISSVSTCVEGEAIVVDIVVVLRSGSEGLVLSALTAVTRLAGDSVLVVLSVVLSKVMGGDLLVTPVVPVTARGGTVMVAKLSAGVEVVSLTVVWSVVLSRDSGVMAGVDVEVCA